MAILLVILSSQLLKFIGSILSLFSRNFKPKSLFIQFTTPNQVSLFFKSNALNFNVAGCTLASFSEHSRSSISFSTLFFLCMNIVNLALNLWNFWSLRNYLVHSFPVNLEKHCPLNY